LYAEQLSGTAFTAPRVVNRRTWLYRMRPSVAHKPFQSIEQEGCAARRLTKCRRRRINCDGCRFRFLLRRSAPIYRRPDYHGGQWQHAYARGVAIHIYVANRSMTDRFFYNADGEMLIVPQQGRLLLRTEMGILEAAPGEIAVIQRGIRFRVELLDKEARGYICENYGALLRLPDLGRLARTDWRIRATFWRQWRALRPRRRLSYCYQVSGKAMGGGHRSLASERSGMARELRALQI